MDQKEREAIIKIESLIKQEVYSNGERIRIQSVDYRHGRVFIDVLKNGIIMSRDKSLKEAVLWADRLVVIEKEECQIKFKTVKRAPKRACYSARGLVSIWKVNESPGHISFDPETETIPIIKNTTHFEIASPIEQQWIDDGIIFLVPNRHGLQVVRKSGRLTLNCRKYSSIIKAKQYKMRVTKVDGIECLMLIPIYND